MATQHHRDEEDDGVMEYLRRSQMPLDSGSQSNSGSEPEEEDPVQFGEPQHDEDGDSSMEGPSDENELPPITLKEYVEERASMKAGVEAVELLNKHLLGDKRLSLRDSHDGQPPLSFGGSYDGIHMLCTVGYSGSMFLNKPFPSSVDRDFPVAAETFKNVKLFQVVIPNGISINAFLVFFGAEGIGERHPYLSKDRIHQLNQVRVDALKATFEEIGRIREDGPTDEAKEHIFTHYETIRHQLDDISLQTSSSEGPAPVMRHVDIVVGNIFLMRLSKILCSRPDMEWARLTRVYLRAVGGKGEVSFPVSEGNGQRPIKPVDFLADFQRGTTSLVDNMPLVGVVCGEQWGVDLALQVYVPSTVGSYRRSVLINRQYVEELASSFEVKARIFLGHMMDDCGALNGGGNKLDPAKVPEHILADAAAGNTSGYATAIHKCHMRWTPSASGQMPVTTSTKSKDAVKLVNFYMPGQRQRPTKGEEEKGDVSSPEEIFLKFKLGGLTADALKEVQRVRAQTEGRLGEMFAHLHQDFPLKAASARFEIGGNDWNVIVSFLYRIYKDIFAAQCYNEPGFHVTLS
ncbi:hypothetical protein CYMTET_29579 [Cymbomonas tetramitiformis]|uniref:Uncharacterized protein n=1 Tax=Cymbomonas tetramitiformis TaxID=36881 RepID=A0AAE0KV04_9CHLO|nr:hypothetical protein CYMTET_29579 [Cymbomonas tetramitiformis]